MLQLLPLNEMAPGQQSPYSAITAMAIDPIYIDLSAVPDFAATRWRGVTRSQTDRDRLGAGAGVGAHRLRHRPDV